MRPGRDAGWIIYARRVPRVWLYSMAILIVCLIASMVIAAIKLI
jgi:hypothetical protein